MRASSHSAVFLLSLPLEHSIRITDASKGMLFEDIPEWTPRNTFTSLQETRSCGLMRTIRRRKSEMNSGTIDTQQSKGYYCYTGYCYRTPMYPGKHKSQCTAHFCLAFARVNSCLPTWRLRELQYAAPILDRLYKQSANPGPLILGAAGWTGRHYWIGSPNQWLD